MSDEDAPLVFDGSGWIGVSLKLQNVAMVGIGATADTTNRLSVRLPGHRQTDDIRMAVSISANTWADVAINTTEVNNHGALDPAPGQFTAPHAGCCVFGGSVRHASVGAAPTAMRSGSRSTVAW